MILYNAGTGSGCDDIMPSMVSPVILNWISHYSVVNGARLVMVCSAVGYPEPMVYWQRNDVIIISGSASVELVIDSVTSNDTGEYTCHASNMFTEYYTVNSTALVFVIARPISTGQLYVAILHSSLYIIICKLFLLVFNRSISHHLLSQQSLVNSTGSSLLYNIAIDKYISISDPGIQHAWYSCLHSCGVNVVTFDELILTRLLKPCEGEEETS